MSKKKWTEMEYFESAKRMADNLILHYGEGINSAESFQEKTEDYLGDDEQGVYALRNKSFMKRVFDTLKSERPYIRGEYTTTGKVKPGREIEIKRHKKLEKIPKPGRKERKLVKQQTARALPTKYKFPVTVAGIPTYARRVRMRTRYNTYYYAYRAIDGKLARSL